MKARARLHAAVCLALAAAGVFFYSRKLGLAGLNDDDALTAMWAYSGWHGFPFHIFVTEQLVSRVGRVSLSLPMLRFSPLNWRNHWIPLAYNPYMSAWTVYTFAPFLAIADRTLAIRAYVLAWSAAAPAAVYLAGLLVAESAPLAALAALATASWPYMCEAVLWGFSFCGIITVPLAMASLATLAYASKKRSLKGWYASCAAIGLSTGFFGQCVAFLVAWILGAFWLRDRLRTAWAQGRRVAAKSLGLFVLGNIPLLAANVLYPWPRFLTLRFILGHFAVSQASVRNADYSRNLLTRLAQVSSFFGHSLVWGGLLALTAAACLLALIRTGRSEKEAFLPALYFAVMLLLSPFTLSSLGAYHIVALFPLALLSLAALPRLSRSRERAATLACGALLAAGLAANAAGLRAFWARADAGQVDTMYPRLEALADWLARENPPEVVSITVRIPAETLAWLTRDVIRARYWVIDQPKNAPAGGAASLEDAVRGGSPAYFVADAATEPLFLEMCARLGRRPERLKDFPDSAMPGRISVYRLAPLLKSMRRS